MAPPKLDAPLPNHSGERVDNGQHVLGGGSHDDNPPAKETGYKHDSKSPPAPHTPTAIYSDQPRSTTSTPQVRFTSAHPSFASEKVPPATNKEETSESMESGKGYMLSLDQVVGSLPTKEGIYGRVISVAEGVKGYLPTLKGIYGTVNRVVEGVKGYLPILKETYGTVSKVIEGLKGHLPASLAYYLPGSMKNANAEHPIQTTKHTISTTTPTIAEAKKDIASTGTTTSSYLPGTEKLKDYLPSTDKITDCVSSTETMKPSAPLTVTVSSYVPTIETVKSYLPGTFASYLTGSKTDPTPEPMKENYNLPDSYGTNSNPISTLTDVSAAGASSITSPATTTTTNDSTSTKDINATVDDEGITKPSIPPPSRSDEPKQTHQEKRADPSAPGCGIDKFSVPLLPLGDEEAKEYHTPAVTSSLNDGAIVASGQKLKRNNPSSQPQAKGSPHDPAPSQDTQEVKAYGTSSRQVPSKDKKGEHDGYENTSSTSSSNNPGKVHLKDKIRGEAKVIAGKLGGKEEKVKDGKKILRGGDDKGY